MKSYCRIKMNISVAFPNHDYIQIEESIVLRWEIELKHRFEDRTFFITEGQFLSMKTEHYDYIIEKKRKSNESNVHNSGWRV